MTVATKTRPKARQPVAPPETPAAPERVIRDPLFARRLEQACESHPHVPPLHSGRQTWIQRELLSRFNEEISVETVRKWLAGEARPIQARMGKLAQLLEVDVAWLSLGIDPALEPRERRARNAMADGAVNLVAGLIQMHGGHPAFPDEADTLAQKHNVDLHAIIRGGKYDIHVSLGEEDGDRLRFTVPTTHEFVVVLGVVLRGFAVEIFEITPELIEAAGQRRGGSITVAVKPGDHGLRRIESFRSRL